MFNFMDLVSDVQCPNDISFLVIVEPFLVEFTLNGNFYYYANL